MKSDAGLLCDTYHTTELGERDCMRMFMMDTDRYPQWYAERQAAKKLGQYAAKAGSHFRRFSGFILGPTTFHLKALCCKRFDTFNAQCNLPKFYLTR